MRQIKASGAYSKIANIRVQVLETVLSQIKNGEAINFNANKYLKRISDLRVNKDRFTYLVSQISQITAETCLEFSAQQDIEIRENIFSVSKKEVPEEIQPLVEFIYEKILFYQSYWAALGEGGFSKMGFKELFFKSQEHCVCPYCDSKEDLELLSFEIDHLLPKSEFPLLYIHEMNMFPCCQSCNHTHHGKGNRWNEKYYNFFINTIGQKVQFKFDPEFGMLGADDISDHFLDLIQLKGRSTEDMFLRKIDSLKGKILKDLKKQKTNTTFLDEQAPFYFLTGAIYEYFNSRR